VSALEQNFNPSKDDIERRRRQGNRRATAVAAAARRNRVFYIMIFLLYCLLLLLLLGYPQALSGKMLVLGDVAEMQKDVLFHESVKDTPWVNTDTVKRYSMCLPFYPFRTLNPRELFLARQLGGGGGGGETNSPLIPANTQLSFCFKRRTGNSILNQMVVEQLSPRLGSTHVKLTTEERNLALRFGGAGAVPAVEEHQILDVQIKLVNVWLQVCAGGQGYE